MIELDPELLAARRATLTTIDPRNGRPRSVPICFVELDGLLYSPLDEKPKSADDPMRLGRVRNLAADPRATILLDSWSEDWSELAWLELACTGEVLAADQPDHGRAVGALRVKYEQYASQDLARRPLLRFRVDRATSWSARRPT